MTTTGADGPPFPIEDPDTIVDDGPALLRDEPTSLGGARPDVERGHAGRDGDLADDATRSDEPPDTAQVATLVDEARSMVDGVARTVAREVGYREVAELCSVGRAALVEAAREYDAARTRFAGFAAKRLRWAMIDHVRRETRAHGARRRAQAIAAADRVAEALVEAARGDALPTEESSRAALAEALAAQAEALAVGLLAGAARAGAAVLDPSPDPEVAVGERRSVEALHAAVAQLPERQRVIVERHYFEDERFDQIAMSLGVSKSWACRLHAQAIAELGRALRRG